MDWLGTHAYTSRGSYNITVTATNVLGNTTMEYVIVAQNPVTNDFVFTVSGPEHHTGTPGERFRVPHRNTG